VKLADAGETGLPDESCDVSFLFGVAHSFKDVNKVLGEVHRVLKGGGSLSIQSRVSEKELLRTVTANGLFNFRRETKRISVFEKT